MKNFQAVLLVLVAMVVLGAFFVGSASAEATLVALWLVNGAAISANLNGETDGEVLLEDIKVSLVGDAAAICGVIFEGTVGAEGKDEIAKVLDVR